MFIQPVQTRYTKDGSQVAGPGLFLVLIGSDAPGFSISAEREIVTDTPDIVVTHGQESSVKALVVNAKLEQLGHFMMGSVLIDGKYEIVLSGSYGADGLIKTVPAELYDNYGVYLPRRLYDAWNNGGGWNSAGKEADSLRKWAGRGTDVLRVRSRMT